MNRYDKEERIIKDFQKIDLCEIGLLPERLKTKYILNSIHNERNWKKWIDSSSKDKLPPDFYNPKSKLMMEIMRIDDHTRVDEKGKVINPYNKRESELYKELTSKHDFIKEIAEQGNLIINPYIDLPSEEDHNYTFYISCFNRVIKKHIAHIINYKINHPGFKTIFFVLDESSPYVSCFEKENSYKVGEQLYAQLHLWWQDYNMLSCLKESRIDYLIWMTPYKHFDSIEKVELPKAMVFDVKKINYSKLIKYNLNKMQSLEI